MKLSRRSIIKGVVAFAATSAFGMPAVLAQQIPIKIGIMFPLSGPQEQVGQGWLAGAEIAIEQTNRAGGLLGRKLEAIVRDDKGTSVGAVAAMREMNDLGVKLYVGAGQSPMALGLAPMLPELNAVLAGCPTAMSMTHENFTRHFFRVGANARMFCFGLGRGLAQKFPDITQWASIAFDSEAGRDAISAFQDGLKQTSKAKLSFGGPIYTSPTAADYKVEISKIMNSGAEGLYLGLLVGPAISFLQQARSVGLTQKLKVIGEGGSDVILGRSLKKAMPTNVWGRGYWYPQDPSFSTNPISQKLYTDYIAKTNDKYPLGISQLGHKMTLAVLEGIKKAGSPDTAEVIAAMEGLEFDCAEGKQVLRKEDHQAIGMGHYANYMPLDEEPFHGVREVIKLPDAETVEPASPGVSYKRT
jgi:branched-chain amino acid transport system substrate-binding protein